MIPIHLVACHYSLLPVNSFVPFSPFFSQQKVHKLQILDEDSVGTLQCAQKRTYTQLTLDALCCVYSSVKGQKEETIFLFCIICKRTRHAHFLFFQTLPSNFKKTRIWKMQLYISQKSGWLPNEFSCSLFGVIKQVESYRSIRVKSFQHNALHQPFMFLMLRS